jgi:pilus assembly protein CpaF
VVGEMQTTGIRPKFTPRLEMHGFTLPPEMFAVGSDARRR